MSIPAAATTSSQPVAASGAWTKPDEYTVRAWLTETPFRLDMDCTFDADGRTVSVSTRIHPMQGKAVTIKGERLASCRRSLPLPVAGVGVHVSIHFRFQHQTLGGVSHVQVPPYYRNDEDKVIIFGGKACRLPTEAEWEYAFRAGATSRWFCGDGAQVQRQVPVLVTFLLEHDHSTRKQMWPIISPRQPRPWPAGEWRAEEMVRRAIPAFAAC